MVCFGFNVILTAELAESAEPNIFSFARERPRQVGIQAQVIEKSQALGAVINIKLTIRMV
jgi:hypothetical protein